MKKKYIILACVNGCTKEFDFTVDKKAEAISCYKEIKVKAERAKFFSIDSEDEDMWYDLSNKY